MMGSNEIIPKVIQAVAGEGYSVYAYFSDGTVRLFDASDLVNKGGVFEPMQDVEFFRERLTVMNDTVAWDIAGNRDVYACVDVDPCVIYDTCPVVADPLQSSKDSARNDK